MYSYWCVLLFVKQFWSKGSAVVRSYGDSCEVRQMSKAKIGHTNEL
jgi:hypothetical protein